MQPNKLVVWGSTHLLASRGRSMGCSLLARFSDVGWSQLPFSDAGLDSVAAAGLHTG
jgi:hypothetical protein